MTEIEAPPRAGRREWIGLAVLALACLLYVMDLTVLHLAIPAISAVGVGFDEFPDRETIRRFTGREGHVLAHERASLGLEDGPGFEKRLDPVSAIFTANP